MNYIKCAKENGQMNKSEKLTHTKYDKHGHQDGDGDKKGAGTRTETGTGIRSGTGTGTGAEVGTGTSFNELLHIDCTDASG